MKDIIEDLYRTESRRVLATLIRLLGDFDVAEDALADAFAAALERWPSEGVPREPRAWLVSAGRFRGIDALRKRARAGEPASRRERSERGCRAKPCVQRVQLAGELATGGEVNDETVQDDQLRLVFTCCHPALPPEGQVALTLREVCGLTTEEIARAFLTTPATVAQRIVRAKAKIKSDRIPYELPAQDQLAGRLDAVLSTVYLVFNEGYKASAGPELTRGELAREALRLGRLLAELLPEPEVLGLTALMLIHEARHATRTGAGGELVLLADQDRSRWDRARIAEGSALVERALRTLRYGRFTLEAAIAAVHAEAPSAAETDWEQIVGLYDLLARAAPSPVVALNRAVAVAMRDGPEAALADVRALAGGALAGYQLAHATEADLLRRAGRIAEARAAYRRALELAASEPDRRFLERRLAELEG